MYTMTQEGLVVGETSFHFSWWVRLFWKDMGSMTTAVHDSRKLPWWAEAAGVELVNGVSPWDDMGEAVWDWIFYPTPCSPICLSMMFPKARLGIKPGGAVALYFDSMISMKHWDIERIALSNSLGLTEIFEDLPGIRGKLLVFRNIRAST